MDKKEILDKIDDVLFSEGYPCELNEDIITWEYRADGSKNYIEEQYIDEYENNLAWWQFNEDGFDLVRIKTDNFVINWHPVGNSMGCSFRCIFLKFYKEFLIVAYPDKHFDRVWSISAKNLSATEIYNGDVLGVCILENHLFIRDYPKGESYRVNLENFTAFKELVNDRELNLKGIKFINRYGLDNI